jgi:hypothetical protein
MDMEKREGYGDKADQRCEKSEGECEVKMETGNNTGQKMLKTNEKRRMETCMRDERREEY